MKKLLTIALCCALAFMVVGCSNKNGSSASDTKKPAPKATPEKVVSTALDAFKDGDMEGFVSQTTSKTITASAKESLLDTSSQELLSAFGKNMNYEILGTQSSETTAVVETKITNIDATPALGELFAELFKNISLDAPENEAAQEQKTLETFVSLLEKKDSPTKTFTVQIPLVLKNGEWKIDSKNNESLVNAMFGGMFDSLKQFDDSSDSL